jgi:hypothetical protein
MAIASIAMSAVQSKMKNDANAVDYYEKVAASRAQQKETMRQSAEDRDAKTQEQIRQSAVDKKEYSNDQLTNALEAEELRGKSEAQNATFSVASSVFDTTDRFIYMKMQKNRTSNIWNLQEKGRNIKAGAEQMWRKQANRNYSGRAKNYRPPTNTFGMDMAAGAIGGLSTGLSTYGSMKKSGLIKGATP